MPAATRSTVLVSPLIAAETVFRVPDGYTPLDHTSILKTVETRWGLPSLTARDAAAPDLGEALTLVEPRVDDPLAGVIVPQATGVNPAAREPSHLQLVAAELASQLPVTAERGGTHHSLPPLKTSKDLDGYLSARLEAWKASEGE